MISVCSTASEEKRSWQINSDEPWPAAVTLWGPTNKLAIPVRLMSMGNLFPNMVIMTAWWERVWWEAWWYSCTFLGCALQALFGCWLYHLARRGVIHPVAWLVWNSCSALCKRAAYLQLARLRAGVAGRKSTLLPHTSLLSTQLLCSDCARWQQWSWCFIFQCHFQLWSLNCSTATH